MGNSPRIRIAAAVATLSVAALLAVTAGTANAEIQGPCTADFNGIPVDQIDTPSEARERMVVEEGDVIAFTGTVQGDGEFVAVDLIFSPLSIELSNEPLDPEDRTFSGQATVGDYARWGQGIYEVRGRTALCQGNAFVILGDGAPWSSLVGKLAAGLAGVSLILCGLGAWMPGIRGGSRHTGRAVLFGVPLGLAAAVLVQQGGYWPLGATLLGVAILVACVFTVLTTVAAAAAGGGAAATGAAASGATGAVTLPQPPGFSPPPRPPMPPPSVTGAGGTAAAGTGSGAAGSGAAGGAGTGAGTGTAGAGAGTTSGAAGSGAAGSGTASGAGTGAGAAETGAGSGAAGSTAGAGSGAAGSTAGAGSGAAGSTAGAGSGAAGTTAGAGSGAAGTTAGAGSGAAGAGSGAAGSGAAGGAGSGAGTAAGSGAGTAAGTGAGTTAGTGGTAAGTGAGTAAGTGGTAAGTGAGTAAGAGGTAAGAGSGAAAGSGAGAAAGGVTASAATGLPVGSNIDVAALAAKGLLGLAATAAMRKGLAAAAKKHGKEAAGAPDQEAYWFHVEAPTAVYPLSGEEEVIGWLPGDDWYLARATYDEWVLAQDPEHGVEGFVARGAIHRASA